MKSIKKNKIYVFSRNEVITGAISTILTDNSYEASFFCEEKELIKALATSRPQLIILDYDERDHDTLGFFTQLKTGFVNIPIVLLFPAGALDKLKKLFESTRPDEILKKPFKAMELLNKVSKVLYSGDLSKYPFPFLVQDLYEERRTGILHLTVNGVKYFIYIIDGNIVYIEYGLRKDTLGMLLLRQGKITEEQYHEALSNASMNRMRLGATLLKLGYLTPSELNDALRQQVYEKILRCFSGDTGTYSFKLNNKFTDNVIIYRIPVQKIIFEGVKLNYDTNKLEFFLNKITDKQLKIKNSMQNMLDPFYFNTEELKIVSKLYSARDYDALALRQEVNKLLLDQILFALSITKYLVVAEKKAEIKEEETAPSEGMQKDEQLSQLKAETDIKSTVYDTYLNIKAHNFYEILGISRGAGLDDMKRSYIKLVKTFHPDKYAKVGDSDIIEKANEIFAKITNAFRTLSDETAKKEYDYTLDHPAEAEILSNANEIIESEMQFLKGEKLLSHGEFAKAQELFDEAVKLNPQEPEYRCYYGWAYFLNPKNKRVKKVILAKRTIKEALEENPNIELAYYFLGMIARFEGNTEHAIKYLKRVLQMNPNNNDAMMALKMLMTKGKKK